PLESGRRARRDAHADGALHDQDQREARADRRKSEGVMSLTAPIDSVTVTEDRAHVRRRASVDVPAGVSRLRIEGVAPVISDKTPRVRATGAKTGDARVVRKKVATEPEKAHAEIVRELDEKKRAREVGAAHVKRLQSQLSLMQEAQRRVLD